MTRAIDPEFATRHLAGLAALEAAIVLAARALVSSFPAVTKVERPGESPEVATARDLVDHCEYFLVALDAHRQAVASHLPDRRSDKRCEMPF